MSSSQSCRIPVADDNQDAAAVLALILKMRGCEVETAYDGLQAIEIAARFDPRVAILDLNMPRLDGLETATRLRARSIATRSDLYLIAFTACTDTRTRSLASAAGFDRYLVKPFRPEGFGQILDSVLS
jgi:DNA-binding response OmpR family regulator